MKVLKSMSWYEVLVEGSKERGDGARSGLVVVAHFLNNFVLRWPRREDLVSGVGTCDSEIRT